MVFLLVDNFELYEFHRQDYDGIMANVFRTCREVKSVAWRMVQLESAENWLESPFEGLPSYNAYTNKKYLKVERIDSIFWNNSKDFLIINTPLVLVVFFLGFGIFHLLRDRPVSFLFRLYSFLLYLSELIFLGNAEKLVFLGLRHLQNIFSLSPGMKWIQGLFIIFGFIALIAIVCLFFAYKTQYKWLYKYFFSNMYRIEGSFSLTFILFICKPIVGGAIHALLFENHRAQLWFLFSMELFSFVISWIYQLKYEVYRSKFVFCF